MSDPSVFTLVKAPQYARFLPELGHPLLAEVRALEHTRADLIAAVAAFAVRVAEYEVRIADLWTADEIAQAREDFLTKPYP